jgi:hypothetical protein
MKKIVSSKYFIPCAIVLVFCIWYFLTKKDSEHKSDICQTKKIEVKGVITGHGGHGIYNWVEVNNLDKSIDINISKEISKKGFNEARTYEVGDSLIKAAYSNEFTIKRGDSIAVFILDCND